ncbi:MULTISPECIES: MmgE/PrpD family protein [unclassified Streptomyces]|uniref:MmgE/PrpD family protein n=1 Tax=unclassified Streptomyces TaxID=2593676 RepID=UPI002E0EF213|nr:MULTISPECIES: MmgE/PrpD family protein [unclassified Streptomyces]WSR23758.1 MmgE/PrpD family protein [Streptomyces sp. NBC_01205]
MPAPLPTTPCQPTDPEGPTGQLATWLAGTTLAQIPSPVRQRAAHLVLDGLACALIGAQLPWSRTAVHAVLDLEGTGEVPVIGWGRVTSGPAAAVLNGTFIQGFELDDYYAPAPLHSTSLVLPALLSTASQLPPVTGAQFLRAVILGFETGTRVGTALHGPEMLTRGWHSGPVFGTHAAAAAAGALRGLDAAAFEDALGLAATQSAGLMAAQYEAMSKRMHHGLAARNGFYAAGLAQAGYTGIKRVFERPYGGFLSTFGEGHEPDATQITEGLGETWNTERITVKLHAAMGGLHPAIDAASELAARRGGLTPDEVEAVRIEVPRAIFHHGWWTPERPLSTVGAQMNIAYATAVALLDGQVRPEQFTPARIDGDDVWQLIGRTEVLQVDEQQEPGWDRPGYNTRITVALRGGEIFTRALNQPHGGPDDPLTNAEIREKYRVLTGRVMDADRAEQIEREVLDLENLPDLGRLLDLLAAPVRGALD